MADQQYGPPPSGEPIGHIGQQPNAYPPEASPYAAPPAPVIQPGYPPAYPAAYPAAYPSAYPSAYPPPMGTAPVDKNWMGITSLVLGILTLWPFAIVFGALGISAAKRGRATNRTMALSGLILGIVGGALLVVLIILGIGTGAILSHPVQYSALKVGQCIEQPLGWDSTAGEQDVSRMRRVSCDKKHWGQVYFKSKLDGQDYPGRAELTTPAENACISGAAAIKVVPAHVDEAGIMYIMPSEATWKTGTHDVVCFLTNENHIMTESWLVDN